MELLRIGMSLPLAMRRLHDPVEFRHLRLRRCSETCLQSTALPARRVHAGSSGHGRRLEPFTLVLGVRSFPEASHVLFWVVENHRSVDLSTRTLTLTDMSDSLPSVPVAVQDLVQVLLTLQYFTSLV